MCGIIGGISITKEEKKKLVSYVKRGTDLMAYRGPDGSGIFENKNCVLGHLRLSVIDLTTGSQPMKSADGSCEIVFNGEIYGFKEIKEKIKHYRFKTSSDTEVILALYQKYGVNTAVRLRGMFSFAIYDEKKHALYCARDRFGEKPFYYATLPNGSLIFSSEIKAIKESGLINLTINDSQLKHFLQHLYIHPYSTIYNEIHVLPPGHQLIYKNGKVNVERYYSPTRNAIVISEDEAIQEVKRLIDSSVRRQLISDVPTGLLLSGGIDSSVVTAVASKYTQSLNTYSFGFDGDRSELKFAKVVANKFHTHHTVLTENDFDLVDTIDYLSDKIDEPFADSSIVPYFILSKLIKKHSTVALGGDGGDEVFGGYDWYNPTLNPTKEIVELPEFSRLVSKFSLNNIGGKSFANIFNMLETSTSYGSINMFHHNQTSYFSDKEVSFLSQRTISKLCDSNETISLPAMQRDDLNNYLPGDILVKVDRAAMLNSLETRAPFLDHELVDFCLSLPDNFKIRQGIHKWLLKKAYEDELPKEIISRKKQGFGAPVGKWLNNNKMNNYILDLNIAEVLEMCLPLSFIKKNLSTNNYRKWILITLGLWLKKQQL